MASALIAELPSVLQWLKLLVAVLQLIYLADVITDGWDGAFVAEV